MLDAKVAEFQLVFEVCFSDGLWGMGHRIFELFGDFVKNRVEGIFIEVVSSAKIDDRDRKRELVVEKDRKSWLDWVSIKGDDQIV